MALKESLAKVEESPAKVQKFSKEELEQLTTLQKKTQQSTFQFGQLYLSKLRLEEQETVLKNHVISLEKEEAELAETLSTKYGKGSINIDTGEFTPVEK